MRNALLVCSVALILLISGSVLTSPASATVTASPSAVNFGSVNVSSLSSPTVIVLTNTGAGDVFLQSVSSNLAQFTVTGHSLPAVLESHQSLSFQVIFQPTAAASISAAVTFTLVRNSKGTVVVPVVGLGISLSNSTHMLSPAASNVSFGSRLVGSSSSQGVTLTNTGNSDVSISSISTSSSAFTSSGVSAPVKISAGQSVNVMVAFAPTVTGVSTGTVTVHSDASNSPAIISITGSSVQPQLSIVPASVSFGDVTVGQTNTQTITLRNPGTANLTITQEKATGSGLVLSGISLPLTLVPGGSTACTLAFTPASAGNVTGALSLTSNAPNSPLSAPLSGTGIAKDLHLSSSAISLNFGTVTPQTSHTQTVTLTNSGNASLIISQVNISGAGFSHSGMSLPVTLAIGQSTSFNAIFDPVASGNLSGAATVISNATDSSIVIALSGAGAAPVVHSVSLTWAASASTVVGYNLYSSSHSGGPYTRMNSSPTASLSYSDTDVVSGDTYYFVATAVDSEGTESVYSNQAVALIP
jgi:hypothetical protein